MQKQATLAEEHTAISKHNAKQNAVISTHILAIDVRSGVILTKFSEFDQVLCDSPRTQLKEFGTILGFRQGSLLIILHSCLG